jgi:molybdopterin-biosynthesis enzyme MoeA-like protein
VTIDAIAHATRRSLRRDPDMERLLREHYADRITPAALKMADLPEGTRLRAESGWPVLRLDIGRDDQGVPGLAHAARVYILPGIPALLRAKVDALEGIEGELPMAGTLEQVVAAHPQVEIGSYPRWHADADGRLRAQVRVTIEASGAHASAAELAREALLARLDPKSILPDEPGPGPEPGPEPKPEPKPDSAASERKTAF